MTPYKMMDSSRPSWLSEPINNIQPFADGTDMDAPITNSGCDDCVVVCLLYHVYGADQFELANRVTNK